MTKEYGVDLVPEPLVADQTIILPTGAKEWAEKHLEPFDAKKHNTKVVVAELLPIPQRIEVTVEPNARTYTETAQDAEARRKLREAQAHGLTFMQEGGEE